MLFLSSENIVEVLKGLEALMLTEDDHSLDLNHCCSTNSQGMGCTIVKYATSPTLVPPSLTTCASIRVCDNHMPRNFLLYCTLLYLPVSQNEDCFQTEHSYLPMSTDGRSSAPFMLVAPHHHNSFTALFPGPPG